jgi:predicted ATPase
LVTVVGVGGIGKTCLELTVAANLAERFDSGVWFCDLAPVSDTDAVVHVVAGAVGARQRPGRSMLESLAEFCRDREMLVVLDNCEHVLDHAADLVEKVTANAPGVTFVATSREGLGLRAEIIYPLGSLEVVGRRSPASGLFVESATRVDPTRIWSEVEGAAIEQICRRLDGIPLAIELAAARTRSMTPVETENRLDDAFHTLHGGRRSIDRHRTLEAAIEWSYQALDEPEQLLFDRLAVFAGSCDIDALEAVCADDDLIDITDAMDLLDELVSKSLVATEQTLWGTTRYRLLEPLRQFAEDRLSHRGQQPAAQSRHLAHYTKWAEAWNADVWAPGTQLLERLEVDFANLRSAVGWAIETSDSDKALRLVQGMGAAQLAWERLEAGLAALTEEER